MSSNTHDFPPVTVGPAEVERMTGLGHTKVAELIATKAIPSFKVGRRRLIPVAALNDWIAANLAEADCA